MSWGGRREGAGRKPTCTCGECKNCKRRPYSREWMRKHYTPIGKNISPELEQKLLEERKKRDGIHQDKREDRPGFPN